jgi:hypothetical protein
MWLELQLAAFIRYRSAESIVGFPWKRGMPEYPETVVYRVRRLSQAQMLKVNDTTAIGRAQEVKTMALLIYVAGFIHYTII